MNDKIDNKKNDNVKQTNQNHIQMPTGASIDKIDMNTKETTCSPNNPTQDKQNPSTDANTSKSGPKWTDVAMVFVTFGILIAAFFQYGVFIEQRRIMEHTLSVMDNQLKYAIQSGKDTAMQTDNLIRQAIMQSNETQKLAKHAEESANIAKETLNHIRESSKKDRRPWVGLRDIICDNCISEPNGSIYIGDMFGIIENTGKTPAVQMIVGVAATSCKSSDPVPDYATIRQKIHTIYDTQPTNQTDIRSRSMIENPPTVLSPNTSRNITFIRGYKLVRDKRTFLEGGKILYVVGEITYYGVERKEQYVTKFCLMNDFGDTFRFCPTGNDMQ